MNRRLFMAKAGALLAALLLVSSVASAEALKALAVGPIGMTVSDMDRSVGFFRDVLTFEKIADCEFHDDAFDRLTGVFGARVRIVDLRLGEETLRLTQYLTPQGRTIPLDSRSNDRWFQHIAIVVRDMDAAYARLREHKVLPVSTAPQTLPEWNKGAAGIRAFYFRDPDNHNLELIYFPAGKGDPRWQQKTDALFLGIDHNPGNIQQGDALQKFGSDILPESKTGIVANPPFGAERDQASYPNVWKEHATESETTILFVKLMVETLKQHGRCAVIVSEGFLTWDQNSARALRRSLLDECNLQAIFSLPQGVFVNKGGSGPKTSILYFVKGRPTQSVWFYKVTNDGYSLGAHRKTMAGCQLVEALDLFHRYVCAGKEPPETRESFSVPAEWIKALDPRVKDRIRAETRTEMDAKAKADHASLAEKLAAQVAARKLTATECDDRLAQNAVTWESKIANTIAQKIERAHQCAFNLPSYRSPLNDEERRIWNEALPSVVAEYDKDLSRKFSTLRRAEPGDIPSILTAFDPKSALEVDLVHEVIAALPASTIAKIPALKTIASLLARQAANARTPLKRIVVPASRRLKKSPTRTYKLITVKYYGRGVALRSELCGKEVKGNNWFQVAEGDLIFSKIDARNGAFGIVPGDLDGAIVSNEFPTFTVDVEQASPRFLVTVLSSQPFHSQVESIVAGATRRRRLEPEQFLEMSLPLPDLKTQQRVAAEIDMNQATMRRSADELERLRSEVNRVWET